MKKWQVNTPDPDVSAALARETGLDIFICRLLVSRGITSRAEAEVFFNSNELSDPFDIKDMDKAVEAINAAIDGGLPIAVYGDYDCDGITSTYMLYSYLEALGAEVSYYIPDRSEGYGLNIPAIDKLRDMGVKLIITVDNGVSAVEEAKYIKEQGMTLVITDHHQVPEVLPEAAAIVNPHRKDDISRYKYFAGCGIVLKLIMAMEGDIDSVMEQFSDIAAIGTVADIVRLDGENRIIVRNGLRNLPNTENMGLMQLMKQSRVSDSARINSTFIAFTIGPRINAASRCVSPMPALELLLCDDMTSAANKASELCELNDRRQREEARIMEEADAIIRQNPDILCRPVLIIAGDGWNHGIIGIISSKLLKKYGKPNIVLTREGETSRGSGRSTDGLHLHKMLEACKDILIRYGGHEKAAGLSLETSRTDEFISAVDAYCDRNMSKPAIETVCADMEIRPDELTLQNADLIKNLEPFGEGNREPLFLLRNCVLTSKRSLSDGKYTSFNFAFGKASYKATFFGSKFDEFSFSENDVIDILATIEKDEYGGRANVKLMVQDVRYSAFRQERYFAAKSAYESFRRGRIESHLIPRMTPTGAEMRKIYDILRETEALSKAELLADAAGINCCKFSVFLDVLEEFNLIERDVTKNTVKIIPTKEKADFSKSVTLNRLKAAEVL